MCDAPELHLAGAHCNAGVDLAVDRDDLVILAELDVLDEEKTLGQSLQDGNQPLDAVNDKSARHAAEYLIVDEAVCVRVVPEQARTLAAGCRDAHLVLECCAGMNVNEDVVAVAL